MFLKLKISHHFSSPRASHIGLTLLPHEFCEHVGKLHLSGDSELLQSSAGPPYGDWLTGGCRQVN